MSAVQAMEDVGGSVGLGCGGGAGLLALRTSELKRELRLRGLDTSTSFDRPALLELGASSGVLPAAAADRGAGRLGSRRSRYARRKYLDDVPEAPVGVALRRVASHGSYIPSGLFTDGERIALPLWIDAEPAAGPLWFVLDTAIRRTALSQEAARRLGVPAEGGLVRGLRFGGEPVGDLLAQIVPFDVVLGAPGSGVAGLLGADFLHGWDLDLDVARGRCAAWPAGEQLAKGFGPRDTVEIELQGSQGLLEVSAHLRGTVSSGSERAGPPLRAVVDLGQTYSACNWAAARQVGVAGPDSPGVRRAGEWTGLDGRSIEVCEADLGVELPGRVSGVLRGARVCEQRLFWLAETLPLLERVGFNPAEPCAVLGLDTVGRARLAVSAKHRRLWLPT